MNHKTLHFIIAGVFVLFAALKYTDEDPLLWMLIYGAVVLVALLKVYMSQVNFRPLITTFMVLFLVYAATYIPFFITFLDKPDKIDLIGQMKASKPWIEGTRELGGLLIAVGVLVYMRQTRVEM